MLFPFSLLFVLLGAHINSCYHPHLIFKRYIVIKNPIWAKVLINQYDPVKNRSKNAKGNRNKLSYAGLVGYGLFLFLVIFSAIMYLVPPIPARGLAIITNTFLTYGNTLNALLPSALTGAVFLGEAAFGFLNTIRYAVECASAKKTVFWLYVLFIAVWSVVMVLSLCSAIYTIVSAF